MTQLIGITGLARSGKDTVANIIADLDSDYEICSLAGPMKNAISSWFNNFSMWNDDQKEVEDDEFMGRSPRYLAQTLGTEWGRKLVHEDVWITILANEIESWGFNNVVVPDIRFANEAKWIRDSGGLLIRVLRPDGKTVRLHSSELGIDPQEPHVTINNSGSLEDLKLVVASILERRDDLIRYGDNILVTYPLTFPTSEAS